MHLYKITIWKEAWFSASNTQSVGSFPHTAYHLEPLNRNKRRNMFLIVLVYAFTKFVLLKPARKMKRRPVIKFLSEVVAVHGVLTRMILDRGTAYTSKKFSKFVGQKVYSSSRMLWPPHERTSRWKDITESSLRAYLLKKTSLTWTYM